MTQKLKMKLYFILFGVLRIIASQNCPPCEIDCKAAPQSLAHNIYSWEHTPEVLSQRLHPDGVEAGKKTFVCRAKIKGGRYKPGSIWDINGALVCRVGEYEELLVTPFQMLKAPPGALSWVLLNGTLPKTAVEAGLNPDQTIAYICRARDDNDLLPGTLNPNQLDICYVGAKAAELFLTDELEVLVVNAYGMAIGN